MSHYDYIKAQELELHDIPFYGLIMAALRKADTDNLNALKDAFPQVWTELMARYNAPGGELPGDERHVTQPTF